MLAADQRFHHLADAAGFLHRLNRYMITPAELFYFSSFAFNFAVGKLLHSFSQKEEVYNYYNDKNNIFNQYFVKKGWAWTTGVVLFFYILKALPLDSLKSSSSNNDTDNVNSLRTNALTPFRLLRALARYIFATGWWILFTQWCFGLPIMDKVFVYTGGKCAGITEEKITLSFNGALMNLKVFHKIDEIYESSSISSQACRRLLGSWEGGHDPLGHVFLLVHSSLYLFFEMRQHWCGFYRLISDLGQVSKGTKNMWTFLKQNPEFPLVLLMSLWWFMLLMTNMYFHLLSEKLVGLAFGYFGAAVIYLLPRWLVRRQ